MFDFSSYSGMSKYHDYWKKLRVVKIKDGTNGVAIKELVELKPKMYSLLVHDRSEYKKQKV